MARSSAPTRFDVLASPEGWTGSPQALARLLAARFQVDAELSVRLLGQGEPVVIAHEVGEDEADDLADILTRIGVTPVRRATSASGMNHLDRIDEPPIPAPAPVDSSPPPPSPPLHAERSAPDLFFGMDATPPPPGARSSDNAWSAVLPSAAAAAAPVAPQAAPALPGLPAAPRFSFSDASADDLLELPVAPRGTLPGLPALGRPTSPPPAAPRAPFLPPEPRQPEPRQPAARHPDPSPRRPEAPPRRRPEPAAAAAPPPAPRNATLLTLAITLPLLLLIGGIVAWALLNRSPEVDPQARAQLEATLQARGEAGVTVSRGLYRATREVEGAAQQAPAPGELKPGDPGYGLTPNERRRRSLQLLTEGRAACGSRDYIACQSLLEEATALDRSNKEAWSLLVTARQRITREQQDAPDEDEAPPSFEVPE